MYAKTTRVVKEETLEGKIYKIFEKYSSRNFDPVTQNNLNFFWLSESGVTIFTNKGSGVVMKLVKYCKEESKTNYKESEIEALFKEVEKVMIEQGYKVDAANSSNSFNDEKFEELYVRGFEKNGIKYTLTFNPSCISYTPDEPLFQEVEFVTDPSYSQHYLEQKEYLVDLGLFKNGILVDKVINSFAGLHIVSRNSGGYYMIVKKVDGKWQKIVAGQDADCSYLKERGVPKEFGCN